MGARNPELSDKLIEFIRRQKLYTVATAVASGTINLSPKGMDSLRILSPGELQWLNVTGSGNETAAHLAIDPRMTIMFCSFDEQPMIGTQRTHSLHWNLIWSQCKAHAGCALGELLFGAS